MKAEKRILFAFILNLAFSFFEFFGGLLVGSVAILSDALHDIGDAVGIGVSLVLERKSKRPPDGKYTYGYARLSVVGGVTSSLILLVGSVFVICNAIGRIITPTEIRYDGMLVFAIFGVCVNLGAAIITQGGTSLNQRAVNLHMLEDVLGWLAVLIGALVMRFTALAVLDPIISIGVAGFIFVGAIRGLKEAAEILLERSPREIRTDEIQGQLCEIDGVLDAHHLHIWTMDGQTHLATLHIVADGDPLKIKHAVRGVLAAHGITHATLELEGAEECCHAHLCHICESTAPKGHHCHHRH